MKKSALFLSALLIYLSSSAQTKKSFEISFIGRYDRHADYVSNFGGRVYNDTNRLYGFSYGVNGIFRQQIAKTYFVSLGIGYYQLRVDKIKGNIPFNIPGTRTGRNIDYPNFTDLLYSTTQYHYNDLAFTIGLDRELQIKRNLKFDIAAEFLGYKTFSQKYRLMNSSKFYSTHNNQPLEFGANINAGFIKEYKKFYLRPSLIIPIYQNLKGDKVFRENQNMNISKWFNGIGVSLKIGKYF